MAHKLITELNSVENKISNLLAIHQKLIEKISSLEDENKFLKKELDKKNKIIDKANLDIEYLTISHKLASSPEALIATRRQIARLIRTIDNCIAMLHED